jgi:phosphate transport system substrate-binding protein
MKLSMLMLFSGVLLLLSCGRAPNTENVAEGELSGKITMSGAFAMYPMAVKWGEEFKKLHPHVTFDIQGGGAGKGMTDVLSGTVNFGMVSREIGAEEVAKGAVGIGVTIDAVIPTFSASNPYYNEIYKQGVSREQLDGIFLKETIKTWGDLLGNGAAEKIEIFTRSDACGAGETFAKYLQGSAKQEDLKGIGVFGDPGLAEAVGKSKFSIGYNNVNFTYDATTRKPNKDLAVIPLDLNASRTLEPTENLYVTLDTLNAAIASGTFPSPPARVLYFVTKGKPTDSLQVTFLNWVLKEGQQFCAESGYIPLGADEVAKQLQQLASAPQ